MNLILEAIKNVINENSNRQDIETRRNRAITGLLAGGLLARVGVRALRAKQHNDDRKREKYLNSDFGNQQLHVDGDKIKAKGISKVANTLSAIQNYS